MVEALAQTAGVAVLTRCDAYRGKLGLFAGIDECPLPPPVLPGDTLRLEVTRREAARHVRPCARRWPASTARWRWRRSCRIIIPRDQSIGGGASTRWLSGDAPRSVVTGMGALTPLGNDVASTSGRPCSPAAAASAASPRSTRRTRRQQGRRRDRRLRRRSGDAQEGGAAQRPLRPLRLGRHRRGDARRRRSTNPITDEGLAERTGVIIGSGIGGINTMIRDIIEAHELGVGAASAPSS